MQSKQQALGSSQQQRARPYVASSSVRGWAKPARRAAGRQVHASACTRPGLSRRRQQVSCFMGNSSVEAAVQASSKAEETRKQQLCVSWAGAGIYTFWELGAMKYLAQQYDLRKIPMAGASGGALAAVLAACGVDADRVVQRAFEMSVEHNIWERPMGLFGIWGQHIEQWLDEMLPDNAHELCRGRITVVVTTLPDWSQVGINDFADKRDLINACMASAHVPFLLDYRLSRPYKGKQCVDGSFPDFFTGLNSELLCSPGPGNKAVVFDYFDDHLLQRKGRLDMLTIKSYDEIQRIYQLGYDYAARLHANGRFDQYQLAEVLLQGANGHMSEVLVPRNSVGRQSPDLYEPSSPAPHAIPPHGLVLELQQDEQELVEQLKEGQQEAAAAAQRARSVTPQVQHA